jgi:feruloyl esterase
MTGIDHHQYRCRWALGHPGKQIDFGYRALKETTDAAKDHHGCGRAALFYFQGCSDGGREALMEAQRFPNDFDGIVAGDPASHWTHLLTEAVWNVQALTATPASWLSPAKLALIQAEAVKQCGDENGVIEDPEGCHFDPAKIRCKTGDAPNCLTDANRTWTKSWRPRNPAPAKNILSGFSPGGEDTAVGRRSPAPRKPTKKR